MLCNSDDVGVRQFIIDGIITLYFWINFSWRRQTSSHDNEIVRNYNLCSAVIPFRIAITSLGEERANLSAFRTFVRFVLVWFCRFPFPLGVLEGLWFVIVAFPGLFTYPLLLQNRSVKEMVILYSCLYNFDALKPHFYIVKLGFTWIYIIFRWGGANEYP